LAVPVGRPVTRLKARANAASEATVQGRVGADGLDDQDVGQAGDDGLPAGLEGSGLGGHQLEDALHPAGAGLVGGLDVEDGGQDPDQVAGHGVVEADRATDQGRGGATAAVRRIS
jgi:hypothetical protein